MLYEIALQGNGGIEHDTVRVHTYYPAHAAITMSSSQMQIPQVKKIDRD